MEREEYIYPYEESFEGKADFQIQNLENAILKDEQINIELNNFSNDKKVANSNNCFDIEGIYKEHKGYAKDILDKVLVYNESYRTELVKILNFSDDKKKGDILNHQMVEDEKIKGLIFGEPLAENDFRNTSLGKLKRDLLVQLGIYDKS